MSELVYFVDHNNERIIRDEFPRKQKLDMRSITKMFLLTTILYLQRQKKLNINDKVKKHFPQFRYDTKLIDVINHTTGLQKDWAYQDDKGAWHLSDLQERYFNSPDRYKFVLTELDQIPREKGKYNYNNYTYDILAAVVKKITRKSWVDYLPKVFGGAKFWMVPVEPPFSAFGLHIYKKDIPTISRTFMHFYEDFRKHDLIPMIFDRYRNIDKDYLGHGGDGVQYLVFKKDHAFWFLSYGDISEIPRIEFRKVKEIIKRFSHKSDLHQS